MQTAKCKPSQPTGGVEPAGGSVPEERAAGKRMVRRVRDRGIHVL